MKANIWLLCLALIWVFFACGQKTDEPEVWVEAIEGVRYVMNLETPLKGTVLLEVEKRLEIDPYEHEEVGLRHFQAVKDTDGEVILFNVNDAEAERFTGVCSLHGRPDLGYRGKKAG